MSGKMGKRATGQKPEGVRRKSSKTDGAFGKETNRQVRAGDSNRNVDKSTNQRLKRTSNSASQR